MNSMQTPPGAPPVLKHLCEIFVELAAPMELGDAPKGRRRIIPIVGGRVEGERLNGRILDLGADWQTVFADGTAELDTRYSMQTDDGALIDIRNFGYRHGAEAGADRYRQTQSSIAVGFFSWRFLRRNFRGW